jgi:hypothetical protein
VGDPERVTLLIPEVPWTAGLNCPAVLWWSWGAVQISFYIVFQGQRLRRCTDSRGTYLFEVRKEAVPRPAAISCDGSPSVEIVLRSARIDHVI